MRVLKDLVVVELNGIAGLTTIIDREDWDKIKDYKWYSKKVTGYRDETHHVMAGVKNEYGKATTITLHRLIMDAPKGMQVDHINGDTLNNSKDNLRLATASQNSANKRAQKNNKTGFAGVVKVYNKFRATVTYQGKQIYLGLFKTSQEAARAYDQKKLQLFGQFAKTNGMEHYETLEEIAMRKYIKKNKLDISVQELMSDD